MRLCLELNKESISPAVRAYIKFKVDGLAQKNDYDRDMQEAVQNYLFSKAEDTFIWVAMVRQKLTNISGWKVRKQLTAFPPGLDTLYRRMLNQISSSEDAEFYTQILAIVSTTYQSLTLEELASFIDLPNIVSNPSQSLAEIVDLYGSFLTRHNRTIFFVHQSAKDFLMKKASKDVFPSGIEEIHHTVFSRSLRAISILRSDIYALKAPGFPIEQVKPPDPNPLAAVQYSCIYWIDHLHNSGTTHIEKELQDNSAIDKFLGEKYLYWLKALSLLRSTASRVLSIIKLDGSVQVSWIF